MKKYNEIGFVGPFSYQGYIGEATRPSNAVLNPNAQATSYHFLYLLELAINCTNLCSLHAKTGHYVHVLHILLLQQTCLLLYAVLIEPFEDYPVVTEIVTQNYSNCVIYITLVGGVIYF